MIAIDHCELVHEHAESYLDGTLADDGIRALEAHLSQCANCRAQMASFREVHSLMEYSQVEPVTGDSREGSAPATQPAPGFFARLTGVPWWCVSVSLHILVIALAGLVSMAIQAPTSDDAVIMMTELAPAPKAMEEKEKTTAELTDILESKDVKATDPESKVMSRIDVPPDILAKADLGDHFETINPEMPDTQSAYGNPEAESFHSVSGNADAAGGGGMGGSAGMEDLIGVGGSAGKGKGGGFGGGDGSGIGTGSGAGKGAFGSRTGGGRKLMVMKMGGSKQTEGAVDKGLEWLAKNQEQDGHWDSVKHGSQFVAGGAAASAEDYDIACTGMALLAFLGAGHTEKVGHYKDNVQRAVKYLIGRQQPDGRLTAFGYAHAIAGMALCEATGMGRVPETKAAAQGCVDYCIKMQQGEGSEKSGWTYLKGNSLADMSNTGWHIMLLKSAKVAGLHVDTLALEGGINFLNACQVKDGTDPYGHRYQYYPVKAGFPGVTKQRTAIAMLCRLYTGTPVHELEDAAHWLVSDKRADLPDTDKTHRDLDWSVNLYGWYYDTLVLFQVGGDVWKEWNEKLKEAVLMRQENDGSWNPHGEGSTKWGRVGQTAMSILCMEVYYRNHMISDPATRR